MSADSPTPRTGVVRRAVHTARWLLPPIIYALIPKCPVCLAAYLALFTGAAVPVATAQAIRVALLVLCATSLAVFAVLKLRHPRRSRRSALTPTAAVS